jgi:reactive chlorine resistance protein C
METPGMQRQTTMAVIFEQKQWAERLTNLGAFFCHLGLVMALLLIGIPKFTSEVAQGIRPLVSHSPFMAWMYHLWSEQSVYNLIGTIEMITAFLMALRPWSPKLACAGSLAGVVTSTLTTSFLITTPGAWTLWHGLPELGAPGQFLIKDVGLLGASLWTAAEALRAWRRDDHI